MRRPDKTSSPISEDFLQSSEPGIFVIWEKGRAFQKRILDDLATRFRILWVHEIHWSSRMVWANFRRFYSDRDIRGVYHERSKGSGPFLAILVIDTAPVYAERDTGRGRRVVNTGFLDAKVLYREWSPGYGIHCGETREETLRDVQMLFGADTLTRIRQHDGDWDGTIELNRRDLAGANGWESVDQLFGVMNFAARYLVVPAGDDQPGDGLRAGARMDVLTDEPDTVYALLGQGPIIRRRPREGGEVRTVFGAQTVQIGVRFPGDNYLDPQWMTSVISRRVYDAAGFYRPADDDLFWILAYLAVIRGEPLNLSFRRFLQSQAAAARVADSIDYATTSDRQLLGGLRDLLEHRGYRWQSPRDPWAVVDSRVLVGESRLARLGYWCQRIGQRFRQLSTTAFVTIYLSTRDRLVALMPWLGQLRKATQRQRSTASVPEN